jgi:hypothetical protein
VTVTPTVADAAATIKVNGSTVASGSASGAIALQVGSSNVIYVVVTAQDGLATKTYAITISRAGAPPVCTLSATPSRVRKDGTSTLTPNCSPVATSYAWTGGTCQGTTGSTCTVTPVVTTTYGVTGTNGDGTGSPASTTVTVNSVDLTPILMLLLD